jgi:predicted thioesterase
VVVGKITATGLYVPYTDAGTHGVGSDVALGHLLTTVDLGGTTTATVDRVAAALYWHGEVVEAKLPANHGLTTAAKADLPQIRDV